MTRKKPMATMIEKPTDMISAGEAAHRLGVTSATILNWFTDGKIRGTRNLVNRRVKVYVAEVQRILRESEKRDSR